MVAPALAGATKEPMTKEPMTKEPMTKETKHSAPSFVPPVYRGAWEGQSTTAIATTDGIVLVEGLNTPELVRRLRKDGRRIIIDA